MSVIHRDNPAADNTALTAKQFPRKMATPAEIHRKEDIDKAGSDSVSADAEGGREKTQE